MIKCIQNHGLFSDMAAVSVEQCQVRYEEMKRKSYVNDKIFTAQFITADCAKVDLTRLIDLCMRPNPRLTSELTLWSFCFIFTV